MYGGIKVYYILIRLILKLHQKLLFHTPLGIIY